MSEENRTINEHDRRWIAWLIAVALIVVGTILGVNFPALPPVPGEGEGYVARSEPGHYTNLSGLVVSAPTTFATATPAVIVDSAGLGTILEIRDATTPIAYYSNGGAYTSSGAATLSGAQSINNYVAVTAPTAVATANAALSVTNNGVSMIARFLDGAQELLGIKNAGGVVVSAATAVATGQPAFVVDSAGGSNLIEVRDAATPMFYVSNGGSWVSRGNGSHEGGQTITNWERVAAPTSIATATPAMVVDSAGVSAILEVRDAATPIAVFKNGGTLDLIANPIEQDLGTENLGVLPSIATCSITYTAAAGGTGACATVGDGEIWLVHGVIAHITENYACTGDDCTLVVGDGNDPDGFLVLADAELQTSDTEGTGFSAGWQGLVPATQGAYIDAAAGSTYFVYAPSGAAETIDWLADEGDGETLASGAATIYIVYTRLQ